MAVNQQFYQCCQLFLISLSIWATFLITSSSAITCPPDQTISPCKCISRYSLISCENLPANVNIASIFRSLSESLLKNSPTNSQSQLPITFDQFKLVNSALTELGTDRKRNGIGDLFSGVSFKKINILRNKNLKRIDENAFSASANTTTELIFEDNPVLGSEKDDAQELFRLANSFSNLQELHITECDIRLVPDDAFSRPQPALRKIMLADNRINFIGARPFTILSGLELLNLDGNQISSFSVDAFNLPVNRLHPKKPLKILLNSSALNNTSFPAGIFARLRRPTYLNLDINNFTTVPETVFGSLALRGSVLSLKRNPLRCDCQMRWLSDQKLLYSSKATKDAYFLLQNYVCKSDKEGEDVEIHEAEAADFEHCTKEKMQTSKVHCGANDLDPEEEHNCLTSSVFDIKLSFFETIISHLLFMPLIWVLFFQ